LLSQTLLCEAEALLENDKATEALQQALDCQQRFARGGQLESEWRAWLIAAKASERLKDDGSAHDQFAHAHQLFVLEQKWGAETFKRYSTRNDIKALIQLLN